MSHGVFSGESCGDSGAGYRDFGGRFTPKVSSYAKRQADLVGIKAAQARQRRRAKAAKKARKANRR